jgi:hypothetical protein
MVEVRKHLTLLHIFQEVNEWKFSTWAGQTRQDKPSFMGCRITIPLPLNADNRLCDECGADDAEERWYRGKSPASLLCSDCQDGEEMCACLTEWPDMEMVLPFCHVHRGEYPDHHQWAFLLGAPEEEEINEGWFSVEGADEHMAQVTPIGQRCQAMDQDKRCTKQKQRQGLCIVHWRQANPGKPPPDSNRCPVLDQDERCTKPKQRQGLCAKHWRQANQGKPLPDSDRCQAMDLAR